MIFKRPACDDPVMVDQARINELKREIGPDDLRLVLDIFLTEADRTIAEIAGGLSDDGHAKATHFLRSGALNIGLVSFAAVADHAAAAAPRDRAAMASVLQVTLDETRGWLGLPARQAETDPADV